MKNIERSVPESDLKWLPERCYCSVYRLDETAERTTFLRFWILLNEGLMQYLIQQIAQSKLNNHLSNLMFCGPCIVIYLRNKNQQDELFILNLFQ
jgi:hypothetical protein